MTGSRLLFETFRKHQVEYIFGNPGTSELPFMQELRSHPDMTYVLGLMEAAVVIMADAYAHQARKVGVLNLHIAPGLGNAIGSLYNAMEKQTPLVVTAGQSDTRMRLREPLTSGDLVAMASPVTKWSVQAECIDELPLLLNRAFKVAQDAPSGPVFVALPVNVMDAEAELEPFPPSSVFRRTGPDPEAVMVAAKLLSEAATPIIIAGDRVARADGNDTLVRIAEQLGAPVWLETLPAHISFPVAHPLFQGRIPQDHVLISEAIGTPDVIVLIGGEFFEETWYSKAPAWSADTKVIHIDAVASKVGANYPVDCGIVADVGLALEALAAALCEPSCGEGSDRARQRLLAAETAKKDGHRKFAEAAFADTGPGRMSAARMIAELSHAVPRGTMVTAEIFANSRHLFQCFDFQRHGDFLSARGGGIGQAIPSAIGMKLAEPERPVLAISGDGSALYTLQALWTAAHYDVPIVAVVLNNGGYTILKDGMDYYRQRGGRGADRSYPHFDLDSPSVDFVKVAEGFGVSAIRADRPEMIGEVVGHAFESGRAWLIDIRVDERS